MNRRLESYRTALLERGFSEANSANRPLHFWKVVGAQTAFIVNLKELHEGVGVVYGWYSTAMLRNERDWAAKHQYGTADDVCHLRAYLEILSAADEAQANAAVRALYSQYCGAGKDEILSEAKERRKQFLARIRTVLKPLGFRKKSNTWYLPIEGGFELTFTADKGSFSDCYNFEIFLWPQKKEPSGPRPVCFRRIMEPPKSEVLDGRTSASHLFDWQLNPEKDLTDILNEFIRLYVTPLKEGSLDELGGKEYIWKGCRCCHDRCASCWVQKNYREARGEQRCTD